MEFTSNNDHSNFLVIESTDKVNFGDFDLISLNYSNNIYEYTIAGSKKELIQYQENLINSQNKNIEKINSSFYN